MNKSQEAVSIQLGELVRAYHSTDYRQYRQVMKKAGISNELENRLAKKQEEGRFAKSIERQQGLIEVVEKSLKERRAKAEACQREYQIAFEGWRAAQEALKVTERNFRQAVKEMMESKKEKEEMEEILLQQSKKLENMKKFILIHPTATLSALDERKEGVLVCTKFDSERMNFKQFEDCVMEAVDIELDIPQESKKKFASNRDWESAVEYVKLVVQFWLEDKPYETLYSSEAIKEMLDAVIKE